MDRVVVLFVDDDEDTRTAYFAVARAEGLVARLAANGRVAIARATASAPDVIVLDLHLPDLDGFEVARRLRADPRTRHVPIAIVTGDSSEAMDARVVASGCEGHLVKPFSLDALVRLVTVLAIRRRVARSADGAACATTW